MILCSQTPGSMLKAVVLSQIYSDLPCCKGEEAKLALFGFGEARDADQSSLTALVKDLRAAAGIDAGWLMEVPGKTLLRLIAANLRYQAPDQTAVIFAATEQALRYGHAYCLCGLGDISRLFIARARSVSREIHKMLGFIRFRPGPAQSLVAQPKLFHNTADLILKSFAARYPDTRLVFVLGEKALVWEKGSITEDQPDQYCEYLHDRSFDALWETYYTSQYIATRKNIRLASRCLPQKYWDWLPEGKILQQKAAQE
ncbi:MAG: DUF4130 domain-containing protein [Negativicutes bacterium]|nr:DUF4130 domain-containing protein [Negativicutes bacterium]